MKFFRIVAFDDYTGNARSTEAHFLQQLTQEQGRIQPMPIEIVPASFMDISAILNLEKVCFQKDAWTLLDLTGLFCQRNSLRLKALVNGTFAGFAAAEEIQRDQLAWITTVGVYETFRGQGIGSALIAACEQRVSQPLMRLTVSVENENAIRLYGQLGYKKVEIWENYYPGQRDAIMMEKDLWKSDTDSRF